jgi:hypothetical protein
MDKDNLELAAEIITDPTARLWYHRMVWAEKTLAQAAYERRLAANTPWETKDGETTGS